MLFFKVVWKRLSDHIRNITGSIEDRAVLQYTRKCNNQKIKSYFINEKIPSEERDCVPLIADEKQIIWILGYRMSSACQITVQTHRVLEIKVTEEKSDVREDYGFSTRKRS